MPDPEILHVSTGNKSAVQKLGPYALEAIIPRDQEVSMTAFRVRIEPNSTTSVSYHKKAEELYYVIAGSGTALLDGKEYPLKAGDFLRLIPGTHHGFVTKDAPLEMLDVHSPGSWPDRDVYFEGEPPAGFSKNS
ncbi:MAG: cupin domain-containing protein [Verrucomicrobiota bacterium]